MISSGHKTLLAISLVLLTVCVGAHGNKLRKSPFEFYSEGDQLTHVLTAIATNAGVGINISESINEHYNGHLNKPNAMEALNYLAKAYDLTWYFDGSSIYINRISEIHNQMFRLNVISAYQVKQTMKSLNIWDKRFEWRAIDNVGILMVSGPPRYLELVNKTIQFLQVDNNPNFTDPMQIRVFNLKHASAVDRKFVARGEEIVLPGVATIISNLMEANDKEGDATVSVKDKGKLGEPGKGRNQDAVIEDMPPRSRGAAHPLAKIQADPSINAVIIQDYLSRIGLYGKLIEQLDQPREQLEISLLIIDLSTNSLKELGINWATKSTSVGSGLVDLILPGENKDVRDTIIKTNVDFLATVSALESKGQARVTSRPAIVTENGLQAILDNNETFYVRVQGERVAELEEITYGTLLQVTPRIVQGQTPQAINLDVNIQDGNRLLDAGVESIPTVKNTQISTRATVPEGSSLLIGGYYREAKSFGVDQVPLLGDMPVLGHLFQHHGETNNQMVRLFMISPKVLPVDTFTRPPPEDLSQSFDFSEQLQAFSSLSNHDIPMARLTQLLPCEDAWSARVRRNQYIEKHYQTRVGACRDIDGVEGFRVSLLSCPTNSVEAECRI